VGKYKHWHLSASELARRLGYPRGSLDYLVSIGEIAPPAMVLCDDRRWRRLGADEYVERLLADPPPNIARRLAQVRRSAGVEPRPQARAAGEMAPAQE
jgi:hypothetical protein